MQTAGTAHATDPPSLPTKKKKQKKTQRLRRFCNFARKLTPALCQVLFATCSEFQAAKVGKGVMKLHLLKNATMAEISSLTSVRLREVDGGH